MFGVVLEETFCGDCGTGLTVNAREEVVCRCANGRPKYGGMLLLDGPVARCTAPDCGWTGVPTFVGGEALSWCPSCEQADLDAEFRAILAEVRSHAPRRAEATVGRNAPCPCGSGRKFKKCCG
jgi:hypothetical protein